MIEEVHENGEIVHSFDRHGTVWEGETGLVGWDGQGLVAAEGKTDKDSTRMVKRGRRCGFNVAVHRGLCLCAEEGRKGNSNLSGDREGNPNFCLPTNHFRYHRESCV